MSSPDASRAGRLSISSLEKEESSDDDSERQVLLSWADPAQDDGVKFLQQNQTFQTFGNISYYQPTKGYEGAHRYDPKFEWEPQEEKKLVRKVGVQSILIVSTVSLSAKSSSWTCEYVRGSA